MRNISVMTASFLTFWCYLFTSMISINCDIYLDTAYGRFRGKIMESRKGRNFSAFRGVPYASPPIGSLRFSDPVLATPRFVKAQSDKARCIQRIVSPMEDEIIGVEECLHLNIYTPLLANRQKSSMPRYPVMVWIHGGGFQTGSGHSSYYSPTYLLDHNIVLVTLNYRLGPFGFLSTGDEVMPGNYGLKDQLAALKWVNKYIVFFAGDTGSITLFGNGAGAASAYYFMMASGTEGDIILCG
ncbi:venom carboxylesterase-6 [Diachasma alloeum]|uniref:venom carboxylesterase-6 n=1 Tax=Diachasma alloeum TaxID=454923 RepID=UPI000738480C|nr:venom carboxylesterase-6 [Diachasma alloeum]